MFREKNILFFKVDDCWFDKEIYNKSKAPITIYHGPDVDRLNYGIVIKEYTFMIDLSQTEEEIMSKFDRKGLVYSIRHAEKKGYTSKRASEAEKNDFVKFFNRFAEKKGIPKVTARELADMDVYISYSPENALIGGTAFVKSADKKIYRYKHGANVYSTNANDMLLWSAIKAARREGYELFDLGGIRITDDKDSYYYRHYKYKEKFGGEIVAFYTCVKASVIFLPIISLLNFVVRVFFKSDFNSLINFINKIKHI